MNALLAPHPQRGRTPLGFVVIALLIYLIDGAIARSAAFAAQPYLLAAAVSIDLTLGVTFAYWFLVVRPGHAPLRSALPIFVLSVGAAALTLPSGHRDFVHYIRYLGAPFELAVIVLVAVGMRRAQRALRSSDVEMDVPERIRAVLGAALPYERAADAVAMEVSLLVYAFASWRRAPFVPRGTRAFSYHKGNSLAAILYTLVVASVVEMVAAHFLLRVLAPRLAVAMLAVSVFGIFWLLGFTRSVQLRPILLRQDALQLRIGMHWTMDIPHDVVERVAFGRVRAPARGTPGYLRATFGQPNVLIELKQPVHAHGAYGTTRSVTHVGLWIDELASFRDAYTLHTSSTHQSLQRK